MEKKMFVISEEADIRTKLSGSKITGKSFDSAERLFDYTRELKVPGGVIAGYDHGEFGGKVSFISAAGREEILVNENFKDFYILEDRLYALTGMSNLFSDSGHLYELLMIDDKWQAGEIMDLKSCPRSYLVADKVLFIATDKELLIIENNEIIKAVEIEGPLFVGMDDGLVSVGYEDKTITWYFLAAK